MHSIVLFKDLEIKIFVNKKSPLPSNCPPEDSIKPQNLKVYRLINILEPNSDYKTYRELYPTKKYQGKKNCKSRSISVYDTFEAIENALRLPTFKEKLKHTKIKVLVLENSSGVVKQTGNNANQFSWWLSVDFENHIHIEGE